jgi:hypothetical protein
MPIQPPEINCLSYVEIKCQLNATDEFLLQIHLLHLVGILFPHIIDDARSKPHQTVSHFPHELPFRLLVKNFLNLSLSAVPVSRNCNPKGTEVQ